MKYKKKLEKLAKRIKDYDKAKGDRSGMTRPGSQNGRK
jgi:hypothetical protein